MKDKTVSMA